MSSVIKFGEDVAGYNIRVLNEREIRAAAGILFLIMFVSIQTAATTANFLLLKYAVTIFLTDILIRVFVNPKFSPFLIMGRLIVRKQVPEYVGAQQKKFAWIIGVTLAGTMFILIVIANTYSVITGLICLICLVFLFFESAFGICLGCKFYSLFYKEKAQYCPGEVCEVKDRQEIQKTSKLQLIILLVFIAYFVVTIFVLNDTFKVKPHPLFGDEITVQTE
jgi:hypothetical protein